MTFPSQLELGAPVGTTAGWILGQLAVVYPSDADLTLTSSGATPQSTNNALQVTSGVSLTTTRKLIVPLSFGQQYTVQNNTTGGQAIEIIGPSGTGVTVPNGATVSVVCDGTNYNPQSGGVVSSFVWQPGGTAGGNVYTTWASLYEAISAISGAYTIVVDTTHGTATVPAGAYALGDAPTFLGLTPASILKFGPGASISFSTITFENLHFTGPAASALASNTTTTAWNVYFINVNISQTLPPSASVFQGNINITFSNSFLGASKHSTPKRRQRRGSPLPSEEPAGPSRPRNRFASRVAACSSRRSTPRPRRRASCRSDLQPSRGSFGELRQARVDSPVRRPGTTGRSTTDRHT